MFTLNIFNRKTSKYLFSVSQNTRKQCLAIANKKYADMAWDWDDKNYIKNKKFNVDPNSTVMVYGVI
jgi:hypothetical protein